MRVFYARAADNPNYAIAHALASLVEPPERVDLALFRGTHTPLLPRNFRPETEGLANPGLYDLVILAGVDPIALTPREQLALVGYVERGGGLMLVGGQHAFANAQGTYLLLASILPVRIGRAPDAVVNALPRLEAHPLSRGLPEPLGYVSRAHVVEPKPRAQVAMWAGKRPVVVAGESGAGRVVVVATFPECAESEYGWFFTGDAFDDFMRNAVRWLTRREIPAWIERFSLPKRRLHPGEEGFGKIAVSGAGSAELKVRSRLRRADGQTVREATGPVRPDRKREAIFSFRLPDEPAAAGLHYVVVDLLGPDGVLDRRDVAVEVVNPTRAELDFEHGRRCVRAGGVLRFRAVAISDLRRPPEEVGLEISLVDPNGREVIPPRHLSARLGGQRSEPQEMELRLPELRPGPYRLRLETLVAGQRADVTSEEIRIIARHAGERFGVVVGGVWQLDSAAAEDAAAEIAAAGATAAFLKGPAARRWGERRHDEAMSAHAEASALGLGMDVWREVALDAKPGANARDLARTAAPALEALSNLGERAVAWVPFPGGLGPASLARRVAAELRRLRDELAPEVRLATCLDPRLLATGRDEAGMADVLPWAEAFDVLEAGRARERGHSRAVLSYVRTLADALGKSFGAVVETEASYPPPAEAAWAALVEGATHLRVAGNEPWAGTRRERPLREALGGFLSAMTRLGPFLARAERVASPVALIVGPGLDGDGLVAAHGFLCSALGCVDILDWHLLDERALASRKAIAIMGVRTLPRRVVQAIVAFVERGGLLLCDRTEFEDEAGDAVEWPPSFFGTAETAVVEDVSVRRRRFGEGRTVAFTPNLLAALGWAASSGVPSSSA